MKKILLLSLFVLLFVAACSSAPDTSDNESDKQKESTTDSTDDDVVEDDTETTEDDKEPVEKETEDEADGKEEDAAGDSDNSAKSIEDQLTDLGFDIFEAQREEDYKYLKEILSKGSSLNEDNQIFTFDDVTYPHEQELIQAEKDNIEFRYTHEENENLYIVGFAVVDKETESSFTVDFQFVQEDGKWKMNDMDMNK